jgi:hypothetical protein
MSTRTRLKGAVLGAFAFLVSSVPYAQISITKTQEQNKGQRRSMGDIGLTGATNLVLTFCAFFVQREYN